MPKNERRRFLCETRYGNYTNENILEMFTFCVSLFWQSCAAFFLRLFRVWCLSYCAHLEMWFASTTSNLRCWDFFLPSVALFFSLDGRRISEFFEWLNWGVHSIDELDQTRKTFDGCSALCCILLSFELSENVLSFLLLFFFSNETEAETKID